MSTRTEVFIGGTPEARTYTVNNKVIARQRGFRIDPNGLLGAPYVVARDEDEAQDGAYTVAKAYAAGYDAGLAEGAPVTAQRARAIADEQIAKALESLTVEVKR
ncbi:hypothetical protein OE265_07795 [Mycobacteroides abscessus]|uniref:hypothetical protein n=1 Tax=Mycobacteroides abscessus TaxID=36809 RepID=UPI0021D7C6E9|nr:hypothetical protein [Mycobacteroides abscessus]MCU8690105.1 hypothetical protein [Mycobacteroides abscessus]MCU8709314.1 hypothetical protein [Mycobacteroides abscessus]MCU8714012.1 hypothetical protein [Mycobacteroides abscessus]MCU8748074.1 hypothetical protein [Mycobacteroides abscessus]MCU8758955.1 hypothetical protein [Mycobacteroides abscessus]